VVENTVPVSKISPDDAQLLQQTDPWFYSHYVYAADLVIARLGNYINLAKSQLFDFGCGDGIMALGVSRSGVAGVTGLDVTQAFKTLSDKALQTLKLKAFPTTLNFTQIDPSIPLPFADNHFDGGYSWSVFEHVATMDAALAEVYRVLKPNAAFFLQIEPFFTSPFGSHMQRLIKQPWAHLLIDEQTYSNQLKQAKDTIPENEKDIMYRENEFENVKNYLIGEYLTLNKLTVKQLLEHVLKAGFNIMEMHTTQVTQFTVPEVLLNDYSDYDLRTNEIHLILTK
jgi:ubiquinone/menaquinone biosynthesis C-methylase UbiE